MKGRDSRETHLERGRAAYAAREWLSAYEALSAGDALGALAAQDLDRLAVAAELTGHSDEFAKANERAYQAWLDEGVPTRAARAAFWIGFRARMKGDVGHGAAWLGRAQRLVDAQATECAERAYLLLSEAFAQQRRGEDEACLASATEAVAVGERCGDAEAATFARNVQGRVMMRLGKLEAGMSMLDESMLAVTAGAVSPLLTGLIYCGVIASCWRVHAIERAREWTAALSDWCEAQPGPVSFHGTCMVHRAELLLLGGAWAEALEEARLASRAFAIDGPVPGGLGEASYQEGEIHRLRGDFEAAEACFRAASQHGAEPQPGLALMRLSQGRADVAASGLRRAMAEVKEPLARARLLPGAIEIFLGVGDLAAAREAAAELDRIASTFTTEALGALSAEARGRVHLAEGDPQAALGPLRRAFWVWQRLQAPYRAARSRVELARACRALGDEEGARLELAAARAAFEELAAAPDLAALDALAGGAAPGAAKAPRGLTQRELQVLRLVAAGKTNKAIARELFLSEKTVDRHVSNIFAKVDVNSRAAATAWAYEHGLV